MEPEATEADRSGASSVTRPDEPQAPVIRWTTEVGIPEAPRNDPRVAMPYTGPRSIASQAFETEAGLRTDSRTGRGQPEALRRVGGNQSGRSEPSALSGSREDAPPTRYLTVVWTEVPSFYERDLGNAPTGFFGDLTRRIARIANLEIRYRQVDTIADLLDAYERGEGTFFAGVSDMPLMRRNAEYSKPIGDEKVFLYVPNDSVAVEELAVFRGRTIGIMSRTLIDEDLPLLSQNNVVIYPGLSSMVGDLLAGRIDGFVSAHAATFNYLLKARLDNRVTSVGPPLTGWNRYVAVGQEFSAYLPQINDAIDQLRLSGELARIERTWNVNVPDPVPDVLVVGVYPFPPYQVIREDGSFTGFGVEALRQIASRAGLQIRFRRVGLQEWVDGLQAGTIDMLPLVSVNPARASAIDLTMPVERSVYAIFAQLRVASEIEGLTDLVGRRVGALEQSHAMQLLRGANLREPERFRKPEPLFAALSDGELDAVLFPLEAGRQIVERMGLFDVIAAAQPPFHDTSRAIALRRGLGPVRERLNAVIPGYLLTEAHARLRQEWFGVPPFWTNDRVRLAVVTTAVIVAGFLTALLAASTRARRRAERSELVSQGFSDRLRAILDAAQSGIVGLDFDGMIRVVNPTARRMLGGINAATPFHWPDAIEFLDYQHLQPLDPSRDPIRRAMAGEEMTGETAIMSRREGDEPRYVRVSSAPIESQETTDVRAVLIIDDITAQELTRQQAERASRLDALGQLTGGIAHDFNNLLAAIEYSIQLALQTGDKRTERFLNTALGAVRRGADLTRRLLAFAKRQPGSEASAYVPDLLNDFAALAEPLIKEDITLDFIAERSDLWVRCDTGQLENALLNLVINSRDAIERAEKGDRIVVRARGVMAIDADATRQREYPGSYIADRLRTGTKETGSGCAGSGYEYVEFTVTDNGPGMTDEVARRATDPFFTTKDPAGSTGLGLSMVYGFLHQSKGEMRIISELGVGTTVRMLLPRGIPEDLGEQQESPAPVARGKGQRILIVEDEEALLTTLTDIVRAMGYTVETAPSGRQALDMLRDGLSVDLLLTDVVMPGGVGGFELAHEVRQRTPDLPVVYMSGYTGFSETEMGDVPAPLVQKPCTPAELARVIETELRAARSPVALQSG